MAMKYMVAVWEQDGLTPKEKLVGLCIADLADLRGSCQWCPIDYIIKRCALSRSSVFEAIKALEEKDVILREPREANNGGRKSNRYMFNSNIFNTVVAERQQSTSDIIGPESGPISPESGRGVGPESGPISPESGRGSPESGPTHNIDLRPSTLNIPPPDARAAHAQNLISKAHPDYKRVFQYGSDLFPQLLVKNPHAIHLWLNKGIDADLDIIPEFEAQKGTEVQGWGWFTRNVTASMKSRLGELPEVKEKKSGAPKTFAEMKAEKSREALRKLDEKYGVTTPTTQP